MVFTARMLRMVTFLGEWVLAVPLISQMVLVATEDKILLVFLCLHMLSVITSKKARLNHIGNTMGVIACLASYITSYALILHFISAFFLLFNQFTRQKRVQFN